MTITFLTILFNALSLFILAFLAMNKKKKTRMHFNFYISLLLLSITYFAIFFAQFSHSDFQAYWIFKIMMFALTIMPIFIFRGIIYYLAEYNRYRIVLILIYISAGILVASTILDFLVTGAEAKLVFNFWPNAGLLAPFHNLYLFLVLFMSSWILGRAYSYTTPSKKQQIRYFIIGLIGLYVSLTTNYFLWFDYNIFPVGNYFLTLIIFGTYYILLTNRLVDFKLVFRKSTVYISSLIVILLIVFFLEYLSAAFLKDILAFDDFFILIFAIFIFPIIKEYFYKLANRYFFTSLYDVKNVIAKFNENLRKTIELKQIFSLIDFTLSKTFHSMSISVLFYSRDLNRFKVKYNNGFDFQAQTVFPNDQKIFNRYLKRNKSLVVSDVKRNSDYDYRAIMKTFNQYKVEVVVPLLVKNEVIGMIVMDAKTSGDIYNKEDVEVLNLIGSQSAVAIDNAVKYENIKNFKYKLEKEIENATQELRHVNQELMRVDEAKSGFISIASHQLRTPLTVVKGYISMLLEDSFGEIKPSIKDALKKVFESSNRLIELVEDLLDISRIESGNQEYTFEKQQLEDLVKSVVDGLVLSAKEKGVELKLELENSPLPPVNIDQEKLRQSCMNLVENAIKYTCKAREGDGFVHVKVFHPENRNILRVEVLDNGFGISEEDMPKLFQKFSRGANKSIKATEGTGLGLYVAKQIIEDHKGKIRVESKGEFKGAKFSFDIPILK